MTRNIKFPIVSIICPVYNHINSTLKTLQSIQQLSYPKDKLEIIVVDNGSDDKTLNVLSKFKVKSHHGGTNLQVLRNKENLGFAKAVNKGIRKARGKLLFIINNDIVFKNNFLKILVKYLIENPAVGIIGGKIYFQNPKNKILFSGASMNPWTGAIKTNANTNSIHETEWIQGCAMLIKKEVIEKIGLFDQNFFFSYEDADFCYRARKAGFKVIYNPKGVAWHRENLTIDSFGLQRKAEELYKGKFRFVLKHLTFAQILSTIFVQLFIVAPIRKFAVHNPPFFIKPMLKGLLSSLNQIKIL